MVLYRQTLSIGFRYIIYKPLAWKVIIFKGKNENINPVNEQW